LTDQDKLEVAEIVKRELEADFHRRRELRLQSDAERQAKKTTKLYLVSLHSNVIAFPDEKGRAILSQAFYAKVTIDEDHSFYSGEVEVIAHGDGRRLSNPLKTIITGTAVVGLTEVPETILKDSE
jgi:hypothetical protein